MAKLVGRPRTNRTIEGEMVNIQKHLEAARDSARWLAAHHALDVRVTTLAVDEFTQVSFHTRRTIAPIDEGDQS